MCNHHTKCISLPSPDEELRFKVLALLRKQERRAQARQRAGAASTSSASDREKEVGDVVGGHAKVVGPVLSVGLQDGEKKKKKKREK